MRYSLFSPNLNVDGAWRRSSHDQTRQVPQQERKGFNRVAVLQSLHCPKRRAYACLPDVIKLLTTLNGFRGHLLPFPNGTIAPPLVCAACLGVLCLKYKAGLTLLIGQRSPLMPFLSLAML